MLEKLDKIIKSVGQVVKSTDSILKVFALVMLLVAVAVYVCLFKDEISDKQLAVVMAGFVIIVVLCFLLTYLAAKKMYVLHMNNKILSEILKSDHALLDLLNDELRGVEKEPEEKRPILKLKKGSEAVKFINRQLQHPIFNKNKNKNVKSQ